MGEVGSLIFKIGRTGSGGGDDRCVSQSTKPNATIVMYQNMVEHTCNIERKKRRPSSGGLSRTVLMRGVCVAQGSRRATMATRIPKIAENA